ncbi:MAG: methyltransferase domain-containing protein [Actinobacteria bacterium]|nr:methyltransferase domain-containing protein [Actinomycetota bacterium]
MTTARRSAVDRLLSQVLDEFSDASPPRVLDCGGGSGSRAVPLALRGADVTVIDISVDALATLTRRSVEAGVAERVHAVAADLEALGNLLGPASFDFVLLHGVLDVVDPAVALSVARDALRPGRPVSIVIANPVAAVIARVTAGDLDAALAEAGDDMENRSLGIGRLRALCDECGLRIETVHGLDVFAEFVPGSLGPEAVEALDRLDELTAARAPYRDIAARIHVLARREHGT